MMDANGATSLFGVTFQSLPSLEGKPIKVVRFQGRTFAAPSLLIDLEHAGTYAVFRLILSSVQGINADAWTDPETMARSVDAAFPRFTNLEGPGVPASELLGL